MLDLQPFRDAATVHIEATVDRVRDMLVHPSVLRALDHRIPTDRPVDIVSEDDRVEVRDLDGHVHVSFRLAEEEGGTRLSALETVRPVNAIEATKHLLFPSKRHEDFTGELHRLKGLIEEL